jgi:hypothetical protein
LLTTAVPHSYGGKFRFFRDGERVFRNKWLNWHDNYDAQASPDPKWIDIITDPYEAARKREAGAKG